MEPFHGESFTLLEHRGDATERLFVLVFVTVQGTIHFLRIRYCFGGFQLPYT